MNGKIKKLLCLTLVLTLSLSFSTVLESYAAPEKPKVCVEPKDNIFTSDVTSVGDSFTVNITTSGWVEPGLYSYELKLYYDNTLLEAVYAGLPEDHFLAPPPTGMALKEGEIHQDEGYVWFAYFYMGDVPGKTGSGVFGYITFEITAPASVSCTLRLDDIIFMDAEGKDVLEYDVEHGYYEYSPPKSRIFLKVEPEMSGAAEAGDEVIVAVTINEVEEIYQLAGAQFKLRYCDDLLETKEEWVTQGPFMEEFAPYGKWFDARVEEDRISWYVLVGIEILRSEEGVFPEPPPSGSGILATIKFTATKIPKEVTTCKLLLDSEWTVLVDKNGTDILYDHLEHGEYTAPMFREDLNMDRKVDIRDITIFAMAFGSYPEHPRWDPRADIIPDRIINIRDGIKIAMAFGKIIPSVFLKVEPDLTGASEGGDPAHVTVTINEIDKLSQLVGVQFKLRFDDSLLDLKEEWVIIGPFMEEFAPYGTFTTVWIEKDAISSYVLVGIEILPNPDTGKWAPPSPDGTGTLATIKFVATGETGECDLWFDVEWTVLVDKDGNDIRLDHLEDGHYECPYP